MSKRSSSVMLVVALMVGGLVYGSAQGRPENPFLDRADTGELIHVLPTPASIHSPRDTQPTDAPVVNGISVYPASYGSGNLVDHGGQEMSDAGLVAIYWNKTVAESTEKSPGYTNIQDQMTQFANTFGAGPSDFTIVQQYGSTSTIASTIPLIQVVVDGKSTQSKISDSSIRSYLTSLFKLGTIQPQPNLLYGIYFPKGMRVQLPGGSSCTNFCGYHSHFTYNGIEIKYASFPYLNCSACQLPGKSVADMLTIVTSHEIREAVTDPGDNNKNAWYDASGYEADDKCAWHHLYQMSPSGFWVQPEYSNGRNGAPGPGCIVP